MDSYILCNARLLFRNFSGAPNRVRKHGQNVLFHSSPRTRRAFGRKAQCQDAPSLVTRKRNPHLSVQVKVRYGYRPRRSSGSPVVRGPYDRDTVVNWTSRTSGKPT